jgi:hypothetical protein
MMYPFNEVVAVIVFVGVFMFGAGFIMSYAIFGMKNKPAIPVAIAKTTIPSAIPVAGADTTIPAPVQKSDGLNP